MGEIISETYLKFWDNMLKFESAESDNPSINIVDLPLFNPIKKISGCENTDVVVVVEWTNSGEQL